MWNLIWTKHYIGHCNPIELYILIQEVVLFYSSIYPLNHSDEYFRPQATTKLKLSNFVFSCKRIQSFQVLTKLQKGIFRLNQVTPAIWFVQTCIRFFFNLL